MSAAADALMGIFGFKRVEGESMKSDRELLELAARAAGLQIGHWVSFFGGEYAVTQDYSEINAWNPLECDGDALRLAVKLELFIQVYSDEVVVDAWLITPIKEDYELGTDAATRRAIVRAAAAIGEAMK